MPLANFEKLRDFVYFTRISRNSMFCESFRENSSNFGKNSLFFNRPSAFSLVLHKFSEKLSEIQIFLRTF
jgi:hypothetical protein